jgi:hypothetical protein
MPGRLVEPGSSGPSKLIQIHLLVIQPLPALQLLEPARHLVLPIHYLAIPETSYTRCCNLTLTVVPQAEP